MAGNPGLPSPNNFNNFGELLRYLRERAELTQRELALQVGYHYSYMSRIEKNERTPDPATLMARFIPALGLENEPRWTKRLLKLATGDEETNIPLPAEDTPASPSPVSASSPTILETPLNPFPLSLTPLLGRESEVETLTKLLARADVRLITLIGPPGVGKTRLAGQVATDAGGMFAHGLSFIDLAPVTEAKGFLPVLAQHLEVSELPDMPLVTQVAQALRQKNILLVLDNFEQLTEAASQVYQLLSNTMYVKLLVTSRVPLHLAGENQFVVPPLSLPNGQARDADRDLMEYAAIRLFVERARAVQPAFELVPENTEAVIEICRRLDGLPLAIELAAARARTFTPQVMLKEFKHRFDWLARNNREEQSSKQTLRGAIEWSYNLLSEKEQVLFRRLSVFSSGRSVETAKAVCVDETSLYEDEVFDLIIQLTDKSLMFTEVENEETRFKFLETIHEFAREKLSQSGEEVTIRNRHLGYYCSLAERVESEIEGVDQVYWANRGEVEHANMRAAMEWSLRDGADVETGIRLAANLGLFWFVHSHYNEGISWFRIFIQKARMLPDKGILAKLLFRCADLHLSRGEYDVAGQFVGESIELCRKIENNLMLAMALYVRADLSLALFDLQAAYTDIQECIVLGRRVGYLAVEDIALILLGRIQYQQGNFAAAQDSLQAGLDLAVQLSDYWGTASGYRALGDIFMTEGNFVEARKCFESGLKSSRIIGDKSMIGNMLINLAVIENLQEQFLESSRHAGEAFTIFQNVGDRYQQMLPLRMMGYAALHATDTLRARILIRECLIGNRELENIPGQLACLVAFASCALEEKDVTTAVTLCALVAARMSDDGNRIMELDNKALEEVLTRGKMKLGTAAYEAAVKQGQVSGFEDTVLQMMA